MSYYSTFSGSVSLYGRTANSLGYPAYIGGTYVANVR